MTIRKFCITLSLIGILIAGIRMIAWYVQGEEKQHGQMTIIRSGIAHEH